MPKSSIVALAALLLGSSSALAQNINFDGINFPCISYNIAQAQAAGQPNALTRTTNAATINANRAASCGPTTATVNALNNAGGPGTPASCDEYPFASSNQGGVAGVGVLIVPAFENNAQGGALAGFYNANGIGNGGAYTVSTSNVPAVGPGAGQIHLVALPGGITQCYY